MNTPEIHNVTADYIIYVEKYVESVRKWNGELMHRWIRVPTPHPTLDLDQLSMEEGTVRKNTIFVGGLTEETDEAALLEHFSTFGA